MFISTYASSRVKRKSFYRNSEVQFFFISGDHVGAPFYGASIQSSIRVRETFRQITQKLWAAKTLEFEKLFKD